MSKERPILFSSDMVRAILEGRKFQTRRIVKPDIADCIESNYPDPMNEIFVETDKGDIPLKYCCPYGEVGDVLWARETFAAPEDWLIVYRADYNDGECNLVDCWKPSIFMPRKYSRINLKIVDVRVERLQEITDLDSLAEGIEIDEESKTYGAGWDRPSEAYKDLWDSINGNGAWNLNPFVWVIEFVRKT